MNKIKNPQPYYPICSENASGINFESISVLKKLGLCGHNHKVVCIPTGEYRKPLKGEYYLSGIIPVGYKAQSNFSSEYFIAKRVVIKEIIVKTFEIVKEL